MSENIPKTLKVRKLRMLIVDDSNEAVDVIKLFLKKMGVNDVQYTIDGEAAWTVLNRDYVTNDHRYDLVLVDWNMPGLKGIDLLKRMRKSERFKETPFIMVTADGGAESVKEALEAGVSSYLLKPVTAEKLTKKISAVLKLA